MPETSVGLPVRRAACGHVEGHRVEAPEFVQLPGPGDVWSTVDDLARYLAAFDNGELLSEQSRRLATAPHAPMPADTNALGDKLTVEGYGYGYYVGELAGHPARLHPGDNPGFNVIHVRVPEIDLTIIVLSNQIEADPEAVATELLAHAVGKLD